MDYQRSLQYLSQAEKYGIVPGLDSIKRLCGSLGDPQKELNIIHIAGTNGKGSVGCFIESVLCSCGYKTGRFVSPAVMDQCEMFRINGENISQHDFAQIITKVRYAADELEKQGYPHPTVFEMQTAAAFCFFAQQKCEIALIEVGMGGKEDSTNVIDASLLSIITPISLEHTKFLGTTIEQIALHKGGIIKQGGCVLCAPQEPQAMAVIEDICRRKNARLTVSQYERITDRRFSGTSQSFSYKGFENIKLSVMGTFQAENAALAIDACILLTQKGFAISKEHIIKGIGDARWQGRFEILKTSSPTVIIDGAHNPSGAARLRETLDAYYPAKRITFIIGTFKDKNFDEIARLTAPRAEKIYTVSTKGKRGLSALALAEAVKKYNTNVIPMSSPAAALKRCLNESCEMVVIFGSLSFLKEIKDTFNGEKDNGTKIPKDT